MVLPPFLAHGLLGVYDEYIFLGIAVIFIGIMGVAWYRSRSLPVLDMDELDAYPDDPKPESDSDRFRLD